MAAITTALIVGSAIAAGGAVAGAGIQAHAAGKAADTQAAYGEKALALQRDMYRQSRSDLAPYMSAGAGANSTLADLMGTPMAPVPDVQQSAPGGGTQLADGRVRHAGDPTVGYATARPGFEDIEQQRAEARLHDPSYQGDVWNPVTHQISNTGYNVPPRPDGSGLGGRTAPASSGYVQMRAPDGSVAHVPAGSVAQATARGAVRM